MTLEDALKEIERLKVLVNKYQGECQRDQYLHSVEKTNLESYVRSYREIAENLSVALRRKD